MALIGSEIFERLRSSGDTPSVTPFGRASSLREGAGNGCGGCVPFNVPLGNRKIAGDFHRPYEGSGNFTFYRSSGYSLKLGVSLFQEICNIVSIQGEIDRGVFMGQIIARAG